MSEPAMAVTPEARSESYLVAPETGVWSWLATRLFRNEHVPAEDALRLERVVLRAA